jgi:hypothetical protein
MGSFGFSYTGLIFLLCLFVPNILYVLYPPKDKIKVPENKILLAFERTGQALCTILVLIFDNFNIHEINYWATWLGLAALLMAAYLLCWARYFLGPHESKDFFRPFLDIPLPLAVLPVAAIFLLSVYGKVLWLGISAVILGIGHIGITAQNWTNFKSKNNRS